MQRTFLIIAVSALGITTAHGQTMSQPNGQTSGSESAIASDTLAIPTSAPPSTSSSSPTIGSVGSDLLGVSTSSLGSASPPSSGSGSGSGASSGSTTTGLAIGGPGAMNAAATTSPQSPLLLRGEIPDTSTQAASATASAPAPPSPICAPPVPSTDGGSANLTEIAGVVSLNGC
jgi:hypothetical protein